VAALEMLLCTFVWGAFFVVGKMAVAETSPLAVAALRFAAASAMLLALLAWREPSAFRLDAHGIAVAVGLGLTGVAAYNALAFLGFARAPSADGAMISPSLNPAVTAVLAALLLGERLAAQRIAGLGLALAGVGLVFWGAQPEGGGRDRWLGDLFFILSALTWSLYTLVGKVAARRFSPLASTTYASVAGFLLLLPVSAGELWRAPLLSLSWRLWAEVLFLAAFCTVVAFLLWYDAIRRVGAARTASYLPLVPIFGVVQGALILGDRPSAMQYAGMALGVAGVWVANRKAKGATAA
jgi:drug/metabolite transporter (DMT)-like permease